MVDRQHFSKTQSFDEAIQKFSHLRDYVQKYSLVGGVPEFRVQLDRSLRGVENPNIIYPIGDPLFTHIHKNEEGEVVAQAIMPEMSPEEEDLYETVLDRIIDVAHTAEVPKTLDELRDILISLYNEVTEVSESQEKDSVFSLMKHKIKLTKTQYEMIQFHLIKNRLGYSKLEPILRDMYIEDVSCVGVGSVFVVHKIFGPIKTSVNFSSD
ncbi:MAG: hypothetical protein ACMXYB_00800, partial [Candidatus Woesearchaeota archaeon]